MTIEGQDWAGYQASAPPTKGLSFVFVKATEGSSYVNPKHDTQVAHVRADGLVVGHYHFQRPGSPTAQAAYFLAHAKPRPGDLLACDWEDKAVPEADKNAFIRAVQKAQPGLQTGLYANRDFWLNRDDSGFCGSFLWIADPSAPKGQPRVEHPWLFHQYSEAGGTDRNVGNFTSAAALRAWADGTTPIPEDPMADMTDEQIYDAVWRTDRMRALADNPDVATNPTWTGENVVRDVQARVRDVQAAVHALRDTPPAAPVALTDAQVQALAVEVATDPRFVTALSDALAANLAGRLQS
jgi:hypothetical protein